MIYVHPQQLRLIYKTNLHERLEYARRPAVAARNCDARNNQQRVQV